MVVEEETIARIEARPPLQTAVLMPVYLAASFWPWWLTFLVPVFVASRVFRGVGWLEWAAWLLFGLTFGGYLAKLGLERALARE